MQIISNNYSWSILHANISNHKERKYVEALEIQKHSGHLLNGYTVGGQLAYRFQL